MSERDKRRRSRPLTAEERALWDTVKRTAKPLRMRTGPREQPATAAGPPGPATGDRPAKGAAAPAKRPGAAAPPPAPRIVSAPGPAPLDRRTVQRIARGMTGIDRRIDLHGMTQAQAHDRLHRFLVAARAEGARVILVITGKGSQRRGEIGSGRDVGVLRRLVPLWLQEPGFRQLVAGYQTAHKSHGGDGALYIRLRRPGTGPRE